MNSCCTPVLARAIDRPASAPLPSEEWASLARNDRITLQRGAGPAATGTIDVVAADGSVFWVHLDHGSGRVAVHVDDDAVMWRD